MLFLASMGPQYKEFAEAFARRQKRLGKIVELRAFAVDIQEGNPKTKIVTKWKKSEGLSVWIKIKKDES